MILCNLHIHEFVLFIDSICFSYLDNDFMVLYSCDESSGVTDCTWGSISVFSRHPPVHSTALNSTALNSTAGNSKMNVHFGHLIADMCFEPGAMFNVSHKGKIYYVYYESRGFPSGFFLLEHLHLGHLPFR